MCFRLAVFLAVFLSSVSLGLAQEDVDESAVQQEDITQRLESLQELIELNNAARSDVLKSLKTSDAVQSPELQQELEALTDERKELRTAFEQVAIGSLDTHLFDEVSTEFNWKQEITLILQPIVENLKALTDKPRKISQLSAEVEKKKREQELISEALQSIEFNLQEISDKETKESLEQVKRTWQRLRDNNSIEMDWAEVQLSSLKNSDVTWWQTLQQSMNEFFNGRGLTLFIAFTAAVSVWLLMRAILWLMQLRSTRADRESLRTRRRLVQYTYRIFVMLLIIIAVVAVFYIRGDLLLLGLSMVATATLVFGLRKAVPRFISEAQLLLNVGSIREQERVIYNDLPWQVASINMFSVLRNPELQGVLRLPLRELAGLISRPNTQEAWFPSSKGDFVLLSGDRVMEVIKQTPELVELRDLGGSFQTIKSSDFFGWEFKNLSRGEFFGVSSFFGIDYQLQSVCLSDVPDIFRTAIQEGLSKTEFAQSIHHVVVDFAAAGSSSLDYLVYVTAKSESAKSYMKIRRVIQQSCVAVCTREGWGIPFPHMTIQRLESDDAVKSLPHVKHD